MKGLPKNLEDFANKTQVKHTATVLEPSICFHTLVKHVDAEDVANEKIRTIDRTIEVKHITKQLQTQTDCFITTRTNYVYTTSRSKQQKQTCTLNYYSYCH